MVKNNVRSFTLIEILIVTTIVMLMSGVSLAVFSSYRDDKALNNELELLRGVLELAKDKAAAGDVSLCSNSEDAHVDSYSVVVDSSKLSLIPGCDTSPTPLIYPIPTNIEFITPTFAARFDNINYQGPLQKIPLKNTTTNKCKYIQIEETGVVTIGNYSACP